MFGLVHLIVGQESPLSGVSSSLSSSISWCVETIVIGISQREALAVERESKDQFFLIESTVEPSFNRIFLLLLKNDLSWEFLGTWKKL